MRRALLLIVALALSACAPRVAASELPAAAGQPITATEAGPAWTELFAKLGTSESRRADFTERRWFAVRKRPIVLHGHLRLAPAHGLSLHYEENDQIMVVDAEGVLLRDRRGRARTLRPDARAPNASDVLLPLLNFDLAALAERFVIRGVRQDDAWRLDFEPRESTTHAAGGPMVVHGRDAHITRIEMQPKDGLRIEIELRQVRSGVAFTADEVQRFFR